MDRISTGPEFLTERFPKLAKSTEVHNAALRTKARYGREVGREPVDRVQNYLDYLSESINPDNPKRDQQIAKLKQRLTDRYVVKIEDVPESYWESQMRLVRRRGESGDWQDLSDDEIVRIKEKHLQQTKEDQKGRLEEWVDYLVSDKSSYLPDYLKYWVFASMLKLEGYIKGNKEKGIEGRFPERPTGRPRTIKMHPEVNERGLQFIASAYQSLASGQAIDFPGYEIKGDPDAQAAFLEHLRNKNFQKLYTWVQEFLPPISQEEMQMTKGEWVPYPQGSSGEVVSEMLRGKGSGWCIAGKNMAQEYLDTGDLHIYYTPDREGKLTIPRVVIVSRGNQVTEVRGIEWEENVDDYIKRTNVISDKLKELPGGDVFEQTDQDTKRLTAIEDAMNQGRKLSQEDLIFLYETDRKMLYFGVKKDPRIEELRGKRNPEEDMLVIFGEADKPCEPWQIARNPSEVRSGTKAYVGPLYVGKEEPGIFQKLQEYNVEHVYTSFPEGRIRAEQVEIGGKTKEQLEQELDLAGIRVDQYGEQMMDRNGFITLPTAQMVDTIRLTKEDLGFQSNEPHISPRMVISRAKQMGLELCPPELGPQYALQQRDLPENKVFWIGMDPIEIFNKYYSNGFNHSFGVSTFDGKLELGGKEWSAYDFKHYPYAEFVFCLPKRTSSST